MTPKKPEILALFGGLLVACQPMGRSGTFDLRIERVPLANEGCAAARPVDGLPPEAADFVIVQVTTTKRPPESLSTETSLPTIVTSPPIEVTAALRAGRSVLVERLPAALDGDTQLLTLHVCSGGRTTWMGGAPVAIRENTKTAVTLRLKQVNALSCTGGTRSQEQTPFQAPARKRAFALEVPLPDGRVFFGAGADALSGALMSATDSGVYFDIYDPVATVFEPSGDSGSAEGGAVRRAPRIGGTAIPDPVDRSALFIFGGSGGVEWLNGFAYGPIRPQGAPVPFAERLDWDRDASAPLRAAAGEALEPRMLPSAGTDPVEGTSIVLGGFAYDLSMAPAASATLEIIKNGRVFRDTLPTPRVGASVTPLGGERFLVWGGDVGACGGDPALLIDLKSSQPKQTLAITAHGGLPICGGNSSERAWWSTGFHRAARLPDLPDGSQRVLVVGGLEVLDERLELTPNIGGDGAGANAIILTIPREVGADSESTAIQPRLIVQPLDLSGQPEVRDGLRRIWHGLSVVGEQVVVSGGWTTPGAATFGEGPTPSKTLVTFKVSPDSQISRPADVDPGLRTIEAVTVTEMTAARLGHLSTAAVDGAVAFAGGVAGEVGSLDLALTAELWQTPPVVDPCLGVVGPTPTSDASLGLPEASLPPVLGDDAGADASIATDATPDAQSVQ